MQIRKESPGFWYKCINCHIQSSMGTFEVQPRFFTWRNFVSNQSWEGGFRISNQLFWTPYYKIWLIWRFTREGVTHSENLQFLVPEQNERWVNSIWRLRVFETAGTGVWIQYDNDKTWHLIWTLCSSEILRGNKSWNLLAIHLTKDKHGLFLLTTAAKRKIQAKIGERITVFGII